ncbi:MAG: tetratricopeptide repeat protein [Acidimicrobiales bacterium]
MTISRFTPSLLSHQILEDLFVAREPIVEQIMQRVQEAVDTQARNHTLLIGPRGSGKTHIVSLVAHRVRMLRSDDTPLQLAWLPEDLWTIASYQDLLGCILDALRIEDETNAAPTTTRDDSIETREATLRDSAARHGPIVVVIENLDLVLDAIEDVGQQQLRHTLQHDRSMLFVATTTRLSRDLSDQAVPFYAFFTTTRLEPFDVHEAAAMLERIAQHNGDAELAEHLASGNADARLTAIEHLAGGQPRMWATLASAISIRTLDELVDLLLTRFDDLTPYYQEQLARLSPHQRRIVARLAEIDHPVSVKELANDLGIEERSLGRTILDLKERGWTRVFESPLTAMLDQRLTYYELGEPLARIAFQLKSAQGKPVRLIIDFLKTWFELDQLKQTDSDNELTMAYASEALSEAQGDRTLCLVQRLSRLPANRRPVVEDLGVVDDALRDLAEQNPTTLLRLPSPVRAAVEHQLALKGGFDPDKIAAIRRLIHIDAIHEFGHVPHPDMERWIERAADLARRDSRDLFYLVTWLGRTWHFEAALTALAQYERILGPDHPDTITARGNLGICYRMAGRTEEAITIQERVLADSERILGPDHPDTITVRGNLGVSYRMAGTRISGSGH